MRSHAELAASASVLSFVWVWWGRRSNWCVFSCRKKLVFFFWIRNKIFLLSHGILFDWVELWSFVSFYLQKNRDWQWLITMRRYYEPFFGNYVGWVCLFIEFISFDTQVYPTCLLMLQNLTLLHNCKLSWLPSIFLFIFCKKVCHFSFETKKLSFLSIFCSYCFIYQNFQ